MNTKPQHRLARVAIPALICFVLAGCAGTPVVTAVRVPVPVACQETVPDRPAMPTEEFKAKPTLDQFAQAAMAELERREGYEGQLRTALEACTAPNQAKAENK